MNGIEYVDCPRARTWMTPCIARDGSSALGEHPFTCIGCDISPREALQLLGLRYEPARADVSLKDPRTASNRLAEHVQAYVDRQEREQAERQTQEGDRVPAEERAAQRTAARGDR